MSESAMGIIDFKIRNSSAEEPEEQAELLRSLVATAVKSSDPFLRVAYLNTISEKTSTPSAVVYGLAESLMSNGKKNSTSTAAKERFRDMVR